MSTPTSPPVPLRIRLPYRSEEEFIERYGTNVARGGIFIATRSLKPEGTLLQFELVLADGTRLLRGEGLVFKTQVDEGGSRSGMTLRFTRLDAQSKALVDKVIAHRSAPAAPERAPKREPHREPEPPAPPPEPAREPVAEPEPPPEPRPPRRISLPEAPAVAAGPSAPELVLGIDLGMTHSRVAVMVDGKAKLVPLGPETSLSLPSVVALDDRDQFLVGARAEAQLRVDPAHAAFGWKRLIGRRARSRQVRELAQRLPYKVVADARGDAAVELRGKAFLLPEVAAQLLGALAAAAQDHVGRPVSKAVLCVPAYFNDRQRTALLEASRLAGLEVLRIINEPSAVALAHGHGRGLARKRVLAFDLGGSTFDVSIVEITGDDLEVVAAGGMDLLGGTEFDLLVGADEEQLGASDVERTVEAMRAVLAAANLTPQSIDEVLLVGSQSVAPLVHRRLEEALGRPARSDVDPHGAVALGAAILGEALVRAERGKPGASVSEVLSLPIGIAVKGGGLRKVFDRNTRLPAVKTLALPVKSGAPPLGIAVFQGDSLTAEDNEYLGSLRLVAERSGEATLRFRAREDGTLELTARVPGARADVSLDTTDTSEETRVALRANAPPPGEPDQPAQSEGGLLRGLKKLFVRRR